MKIAVVGASGLLGRPLAELLEHQGHEVRRLHRGSAHHPVDLSTGEGLTAALAGVEVVVNAANQTRGPERVLLAGTERLLAAGDAHHVCVSIVGLEAVAPHSAYYRAKLAQEQLVTGSGRPFSIVRSTQFHEFLGRPLIRLARARVELRSRARFAPVSAAEAAALVARVAVAEPSGATTTVSGPETLTLSQLRAGRGVPVPVPLPRGLGRQLRAGALTCSDPDARGVLTYAQWLSQTRGRPWRPGPTR